MSLAGATGTNLVTWGQGQDPLRTMTRQRVFPQNTQRKGGRPRTHTGFRKDANSGRARCSNFQTWIHKFINRKIQTGESRLGSKEMVAEEMKHGGLVLAERRGRGAHRGFLSFYWPPMIDRIFQRWLQEHLLFPSFSRNVTLPPTRGEFYFLFL